MSTLTKKRIIKALTPDKQGAPTTPQGPRKDGQNLHARVEVSSPQQVKRPFVDMSSPPPVWSPINDYKNLSIAGKPETPRKLSPEKKLDYLPSHLRPVSSRVLPTPAPPPLAAESQLLSQVKRAQVQVHHKKRRSSSKHGTHARKKQRLSSSKPPSKSRRSVADRTPTPGKRAPLTPGSSSKTHIHIRVPPNSKKTATPPSKQDGNSKKKKRKAASATPIPNNAEIIDLTETKKKKKKKAALLQQGHDSNTSKTSNSHAETVDLTDPAWTGQQMVQEYTKYLELRKRASAAVLKAKTAERDAIKAQAHLYANVYERDKAKLSAKEHQELLNHIQQSKANRASLQTARYHHTSSTQEVDQWQQMIAKETNDSNASEMSTQDPKQETDVSDVSSHDNGKHPK